MTSSRRTLPETTLKVVTALKQIRRDLSEVSHILKKKAKPNVIVSYKISYVESLLEYLLTGQNTHQLAKLPFGHLGCRYKDNRLLLLEDCTNNELKRFINTITSIAFRSRSEHRNFIDSRLLVCTRDYIKWSGGW